MTRAAIILLLAVPLAACSHGGPGSVAGGECKIFERPQYEVRGKRPYDQDWIDSQVEGGVGGCRWKRPAPRPASLDAPAGKVVVAAPVKRRGIFRRIRDRVLPVKPQPAAAAPAIETPPAPVAAPAPVPPPPPRSAIDRLLQPRADDR